MGDRNDITLKSIGFGRSKSIDIIKQWQQLQKMAINGDVKFSMPIFGNGFPNGPKVSDATANSLTGSYNTNLK